MSQSSDSEHSLGSTEVLHPVSVLSAAAILARRDVPELRALVSARKKGWNEESLDDHFKWQRNVADNPDDTVAFTWFRMMKKVLKEVDFASPGCIPAIKPIEFLDVACSPGGFSSYVLGKNKRARGIGISLPESKGGHAFLLEHEYMSRYEFIEKDILEYDLEPLDVGGTFDTARKFPGKLLGRFPLVFMDGHALRTYQHPRLTELAQDEWRAAHGSYRSSLLIAQLIIGLESVTPGGTIITRLSHVECFPSAVILYLLDQLSEKLVLHKPRAMHMSRGTCYVVAKGVGGVRCAKARRLYLAGLRKLLLELRHDGPDGHGRMLAPGDLDFIATTDTILDEYLDRLIKLARGVWATQVEGLNHLFRKKGIQP
uniref:Ribosomal RNA methyltransferase FtsJ domain-containing protein n=1 Tax=Ganoderma boninense TaxID=34458 RepID=A0A5K1JYX8_9APHY|nr:Uncharacterized protein [Ganoderma boninense]